MKGIKGTVTEDYQGILVHDHDVTFYNYGADHQECLAHVLRYLKDSIENEAEPYLEQERNAFTATGNDPFPKWNPAAP